MTYGYVRVSTDMQTNENQKFEIRNFCKRQEMEIGKWIEETISGAKEVQKRELGRLLEELSPGDILICTELSRLGRSLFMIMEILNHCMKRDVQVWTIKDNYRLGSDITAKALAFAFGLAAEIERDMISKRVKEALARRKAEGWPNGKTGVHKGGKAKKRPSKLEGLESEVRELIGKRVNLTDIGKKYRSCRETVRNFATEKFPELFERRGKSQRRFMKGQWGKKHTWKLEGQERMIESLLGQRIAFPKIAKIFGTTRMTAMKFAYEMHPERFVWKGRYKYYNHDYALRQIG